jgi:hypothetical protein
VAPAWTAPDDGFGPGSIRVVRDPAQSIKTGAKCRLVNPSGLCAICRFFYIILHVVPEIIEDTNEVAIKIGGHKLAQLPRFVGGFGNDLRLRGLPLCEEFVYLGLAVEIEPEKERA